MHPLIEGILSASEARRHGIAAAFERTGERRDLPASAHLARSRGLIPVIAEIKPRVISRPMKPGEAAEQAKIYEWMGACAVSVITEPSYFLGSIASLPEVRSAVGLPVLRKDFIVDSRQIREVEADLVLLIASLVADLEGMIEAVHSAGMEALVEVHTAPELRQALEANAKVIGINNRDLRTLEVSLNTFETLGPVAKEAGVFTVAESGVQTREDAQRMVNAGADAILVGTSIMQKPEVLGDLTGAKASVE